MRKSIEAILSVSVAVGLAAAVGSLVLSKPETVTVERYDHDNDGIMDVVSTFPCGYVSVWYGFEQDGQVLYRKE